VHALVVCGVFAPRLGHGTCVPLMVLQIQGALCHAAARAPAARCAAEYLAPAQHASGRPAVKDPPAWAKAGVRAGSLGVMMRYVRGADSHAAPVGCRVYSHMIQ